MTNFSISIVSDTVCPWCYIGHKRLQRGISLYSQKYPSSHSTFTTTWAPFYLNPDAGKSIDKQQVYDSKFGEERTRAMQQRLTAIGDKEGIKFRYGGRTGNTRDSHRLIQMGKMKGGGMQTRVVEELFTAYFEEEGDITSHEVLLAAGVKAGLQEEEVKKMLESDEFGDVVDVEVEEAQQQMVQGVPHFTVDNVFEVSGAQEPETFVRLFEKLASMKGKVGDDVVADGETC